VCVGRLSLDRESDTPANMVLISGLNKVV